MKLPFIKNFKKKVAPSYFLVLILRDEKANTVVFEELEGKAKTVGLGEEYFSASIDEISQDELLEVMDKTISSAESSLPENVETQKTIFGVKESWTENDQIKKEHLIKLKKTSEELGLTPIGFLVISQAISHLLQKEEGAPISAILTEINKKSLTVNLLRAGKIIETKSSQIHESIPFTVDTLLKHFQRSEILPSRIIIFNGKEDLSQEFISHAWSKSLPFLHLPQITNLPYGFDAKAVLFGAATQMGFEVLEKDIPKEPLVIEEPSAEPLENIRTENFGFTKDIDVAKVKFQDTVEKIEEEQKIIPQINTEKTDMKNVSAGILNLIFSVAKKINTKKALFFFSKMPRGKITIFAPLTLLLTIVIFASYFLFLKASIEITVDPKIIEQNKNILFSTTGKTDPSKNIIKGEFVSEPVDGTVSTAATGKKDVGTKATGTVTIFNLSKTSKNLPDGAEISSSNGLIFVLNSAVNLASASSSIDSNFNVTTKPSTSNVNVTANQLGKESNLPSGTKFSVGTFDTSDLIAKNDSPFSGGTKKEVTVVSKNDQSKLEEELPKQLENKAREVLKNRIGQNKILLPNFISNSLSKKSLNAKIGDEANQITLTGTVEYQGISYDKNDLVIFSKSLLNKDVPETQEINYNNIKASVLNIKNKNDEEVEANLNIKALLLPKIPKDKITKQLKGKSFRKAEDILYKLPQVADIDIFLSPNLPFLPKTLPSREKNIIILIKING